MNSYNQILAVLGGLIALFIIMILSSSEAALLGGLCIFFGCPIVGFIGFIYLFSNYYNIEKRKLGLKVLIISLLGFLIGMSICSQTLIPI